MTNNFDPFDVNMLNNFLSIKKVNKLEIKSHLIIIEDIEENLIEKNKKEIDTLLALIGSDYDIINLNKEAKIFKFYTLELKQFYLTTTKVSDNKNIFLNESENLISEVDFLNESDLINKEVTNCNDKPKKKKACKNCTCGLKDQLDQQNENFKSSCGSCYLGDAFRCSGCPYLGYPAFEKDNIIQINLNSDI